MPIGRGFKLDAATVLAKLRHTSGGEQQARSEENAYAGRSVGRVKAEDEHGASARTIGCVVRVVDAARGRTPRAPREFGRDATTCRTMARCYSFFRTIAGSAM